MIPRHPARPLRFCVLSALIACPAIAMAGERMPFEIPEEEIHWDQIELEEFNTAMPPVEPEAVKPPKDTGPDYPAPVVDAYFDIATTRTSFSELGYQDSPGGVRFIVGFRLGALTNARWNFAPEFGYSRIGRAERSDVTVDSANDPLYTITRTDTYNADLASLDFTGRLAYQLLPRVQVYARGGLHVFHTRDKVQTTLSFEPKTGAPPKPDDVQQPASVTDSRVDVLAGGGVEFKLGDVPSIYAEYTLRELGSDSVGVAGLGLLLNF